MTHARDKGSLGQYRGERRDHVEGWSHGETVGAAWPARSLRVGKAKRNVMKKVKTSALEHMETWTQYKDRSQRVSESSMKMVKKDVSKSSQCKTLRKQRAERKRKLYPLRRRSGAEAEALSCHVLLTRLGDLEERDRNRVLERRRIVKANKKTTDDRGTLDTKADKPLAQEPRKRRLASLNAEAVNSLLLEKTEGKLTKKRVDGVTAPDQTKTRPNLKRGSETCEKVKAQEKNVNESSLFAPTPKRLAGLNAAALMKLTSSTMGNKQRLKSDNKGVASGTDGVHGKTKAQKSKRPSLKKPVVKGGCEVCKSRSFESKLKFEGSPESRPLTESGYRSRSILGYPLKVIKEERVETELSPYYCCPPEGSVEYCHRLALFLGQKAYGESEEHPVTSVKRECLVSPPALTHPTLTLSAHPCLCADPCYSSYLVRIAHPGPPTASLSARSLPCTHSPFCPRGVSGAKLLPPSVSHASGIPHSAFCNSVGSPCCHEACRMNRCTFRAIQPIASRTCSYSNSCSHCSHTIKSEGYSSSEEKPSHGLLMSPALTLSSASRVKSSSAGAPRLLPTLSERRHAEVRLKTGNECPGNAKPPNGSLATGQTRLSKKQHSTLGPTGAKQKKANGRQVTNGWRPVGVPTEREVFIAGDDETVFRQCYEGVERDGEVIRVRDTVLLRSGPRKKSLPYVAKISSLWEDPETGELMMSLFWYYRPEHTQGGRDPSMHCENEIFASRHQDENSVACIEDRCYVLPLAQYCRFCALVKRRSEGVSGDVSVVPDPTDSFTPPQRLVPDDVDPDLVYLCRHVYDFRYGRILKNLQ
nr:bromo adjacent homology domain-containing 1 protein [Misgurnus anguillicaudatus]XP_055041499.1 bromo adjacent homology domain-containing 1 protein [Misgurnus anguillicaudatus]XP_055041500.1 bromo adjacent homology domain-containing 1 protein [Misgurnus anguillicaudatus]